MIKKIELKNFRRYSNITLKFYNNLIIFIGKNACGKTTILEAIYLISASKSHRSNDVSELIKLNEKYLSVSIDDNDNNYKMIISNDGKKALINNVEYKKMSDFIGNIKAVMFSPQDLNLIVGSKVVRRNFLDINISMIDKSYLYEIKKYKKLLKERNELLKTYNDSMNIYLDVLTNELIKENLIIMEYREKFINDLNGYLMDIHKNLYN